MNTSFRGIHLALTLVAGVAITLGVNQLFRPQADATPASAKVEPKVLYWYDPMYPDKRFEQPGKSPFMEMQLVPKYADADNGNEGTVRIDPRVASNLGVRTGVVTRGAIDLPVRASIALAFDDGATRVVQARVNGIVERLIVRTPLATVTRGQPLLTLIAPEWTAAQEEYLALRRSASPALVDVRDAARRRLLLLGMSEAQVRAIEHAGQAQTRVTLHAPSDGVISELAIREGETVMAGAPLLRLNGIDTLWANAAIAETQIARTGEGAAVELHLTAFPGEVFTGRVAALLPTLDPATRTQTARIVLANPGHRLTAGMIGDAQIAAPESVERLWLPSEAVIATGTREVVIVAAGDGKYRAQEVRIGVASNGRSEVLAGLQAGENVVLSGQFLIDSEASLTGTLTRLGVDAYPSPVMAAKPVAEQHATFGTLRRIDGDQWHVDTGPVPSMDMGAMPMTFRAPRFDTTVAIGDRFDFRFFRNDVGDFEIDGTSVSKRPGQQP
jgi:Cu(I)/Ag(I) efflux system membrane fusion protein